VGTARLVGGQRALAALLPRHLRHGPHHVLLCACLSLFLSLSPLTELRQADVTRTKDLKWPLCAGFVCFGVATIGLAMSGQNTAMATALCVASPLFTLCTLQNTDVHPACPPLSSNGVAGIGFTAPLILLMSVVQLSTPPLFIGVASALVISVRTLGGSVGFAIAEAIYGALTNDQIPANIRKQLSSLSHLSSLLLTN